jgi:hypothetical protein
MHVFATVKPEQILDLGKTAYAETTARLDGAPSGDVADTNTSSRTR